MKRLDDFLKSDENILFTITPCFPRILCCNSFFKLSLIFTIAIIVAFIYMKISLSLLLVPLLFFVLSLISTLVVCNFTKYYITNHKIIIETGIVGRDYDIVKLDRILDVNVDVNVIDTIFATGDLKLCTANDGEAVILKNIKNPKKLINIINF